MMCAFKICSKHRVVERGVPLLVHNLNGHKGPGLLQAKAGILELHLGLPQRGKYLGTWTVWCYPRRIGWELVWTASQCKPLVMAI